MEQGWIWWWVWFYQNDDSLTDYSLQEKFSLHSNWKLFVREESRWQSICICICLGLGMRVRLKTLLAFFNPRFIHQPLQPFSPSPIHPPIVWPVSSIFLFSQFPIFSFPALTANGGWPWLHYVNLCNSQDPPMDVGQSGYLGNFIKTAKTSLVGMQINILLSNDKMAQRHSI